MAAFNQNAYLKQQNSQVNTLYDQQKKSQMAQFNAEKNKALGLVNQQKAKVAPQYAIQRNQADVGHAQNASRLREMMASNGIASSGENVSGSVGLQSARQSVLGQLNLQEQETNNDFNRQVLDINDTSKLSAMIAQLEAQRSQALNEAAMRADEIGYARSRDALSDQRYKEELAYSRRNRGSGGGGGGGGGGRGRSSSSGGYYGGSTQLPANPSTAKIMTEQQYIDAYEEPDARRKGTARILPGSTLYNKKQRRDLSDLYK